MADSFWQTIFPRWDGRDGKQHLYSCDVLPSPPPFWDACGELFADPKFWLAAVSSFIIGGAIYCGFGYYVHSRFHREVGPLERNGRRTFRPFDYLWDADFSLALISLAVGSPIMGGMAMAHTKWCIMGTYMGLPWEQHPWGYTGVQAVAAWLISIPVYMLLWDFWFYILHLILHIEPVYSLSHANHHAFKPPVAWSGIAIDPIEELFSGIGPMLLPILLPFPFVGYIPFHLPTVYAINISLVAWALMLHSSCTWPGNWLFMGPIYHNRHHATGRLKNGNYGAIFKVYDRLFGTLLEVDGVPDYAPWQVEEAQKKGAALPGLEKRNAASSAPSSGARRPSSKSPTAAAKRAAKKA